MVANAGIIVSCLAIMIFQSPLPDLIVGIAVVAIVLHEGREILKKARKAHRQPPPEQA